LTPTPAFAGAWVAPEGGQEIWTSVAGERDEVSFYESSAYWEIPIGAEDSVVAAPWFEQNYDTLDGWRGEATLGVKHAFFRGDMSVMAVQAGALWISHPNVDNCSEGGAELRWLGGRSFSHGGFLNFEAATRALEGGCEGERLDLTAGFRPRENWLAMGQIFLDAPREGEETVKAQLTLVRFGESGRGIQIGLRTRIDGGPQEPALVIGLWGRPGD
jgi:hypothetical protein